MKRGLPTLVLLLPGLASAQINGKPWTRHTIDNSSRGAGGVKLIDINTDGRPDVATAWKKAEPSASITTKGVWACGVHGRK